MPSSVDAFCVIIVVRARCACVFLVQGVVIQAWQRSQLCVNMDKALVDVLRSVRANSGEQVRELSEVQDILMSNRIRVRVFLVCVVCLVFSSCSKALPMLDHVEFADLDLPGGISAGARSMLEAVLAAHVTCARQDRRSRSPHRNRYVAQENSEFGIPQRLKNPEIPIGGPRAACENLELKAMSNDRGCKGKCGPGLMQTFAE